MKVLKEALLPKINISDCHEWELFEHLFIFQITISLLKCKALIFYFLFFFQDFEQTKTNFVCYAILESQALKSNFAVNSWEQLDKKKLENLNL